MRSRDGLGLDVAAVLGAHVIAVAVGRPSPLGAVRELVHYARAGLRNILVGLCVRSPVVSFHFLGYCFA